MAVLSDYTSGTISLANGSAIVTGTGTLFEVTRFQEGDTLQIQNLTAVIASVDSDTQLTLTEPWTGTTIVDGPYRARQLGDGSRVSTQAATVIELLGNGVLTNLAELGVEEGKAPVGGPTGEYELVDTSTFGIQDPNGSLSKLAALTLGNRQILQTDGEGALQQVALDADKFLRTDANGDIALSDIAAWALSMLGLTGAANKFPYLNTSNTAALAELSAFARSILDDTDGASMFSTMGAAQSLGGSSGYIKLPNGGLRQWGSAVITLSSGGYGSITFPTAFSNTNWLVTFSNGERTSNPLMNILQNRDGLKTTAIDVQCVNGSTGAAITGLVRINWQAEGN